MCGITMKEFLSPYFLSSKAKQYVGIFLQKLFTHTHTHTDQCDWKTCNTDGLKYGGKLANDHYIGDNCESGKVDGRRATTIIDFLHYVS